MTTYRGTMRRNPLEGGFWELQTDAGRRYQLRGGDESALKDGAKAEISGDVDEDAMGIAMSGDGILAVKHVKLV
jgi:hypothetical protein